ncbi:MAG: hypothetical protein IJV62_03690, partial [Eggerthellaceae bacterium]|nr:hypothetical protein [Eggerthellaceae bacterium]
RDNLGTRPELRDIEQPFSLIKRYIEEKRIIHWFYSLDDEIANISMIETLVPSYGLSLYRISGTHPQVIIKSMATILSLIREFLYSDLKRDVALSCMEKKAYQQTDEFVTKALSDHPLDSQVRGRRSFLLPGVTSKQLASARKTVFIDSATVYQGLQFSLMQVVLDSQFPLWPKHYNQINLYIVRATPQGAEYISLNAHKHSSNIFYLPEENGLVATTWENYKMRYSHIICILNNNEIFIQDLKKIKRVRHLPLLQRNVVQSYSDDFALFELYPHTLFAKSKLAKLSGYTIWHNMYKEHFVYAHTCKLGQWDASLRVHVYLSVDDLKAAVDAIDESDGAGANTLLLYTHAQATLAPTLIHRFINEFGVKDATVFIHGMLPQGFQAYNDRMDDPEEKGMSWSVPIVMYEDV